MIPSWLNRTTVRSTVSTLVVFLLGMSAPACAADDAAPANGASTPVAEIDGKPIPMSDLESLLAPQLTQLENQRRQLLEGGVDHLVDQKVLEAEAAARGISVEELLKVEVEDKAGNVTDEDAEKFYEENQARIRQPKEQVMPQVRLYLANLAKSDLRNDLVSSLRTKFKARVLLEPTRADVADASAPARGPADAPVTIVEFSDFQCPYCSRVLPSIEEALATYPTQVRLVYRQFPLGMHPNAQKAAEASLCASEQGKFWQMHDAMFGDQQGLAVEQLKQKAATLGLDAEQFNQCLDAGRFAPKVQEDMAAGAAAGVNGTPALFVNGRFLNGAVPFAQIEKLILDELARKGIEPKKAS